LLLVVAGMSAAYVPARRAANVNPMEALRSESPIASDKPSSPAIPSCSARHRVQRSTAPGLLSLLFLLLTIDTKEDYLLV
jgi:hypothetical protein